MADAPVAQLSELPTYFGRILSAAIPLIGIVAFIMIVAGGFTILTSAGNPEGMKKGGQTIALAVAGIGLAILSWLILLLIQNVTGAPVTEFKFGF